MVSLLRLALAAVLATAVQAARLARAAEASQANPVRKVVSMLQAMQKKVTEEGEREKELYEKFMCYCKTSGGELTGAISAAQTKAPQLTSDIESSQEQKAQLEEALKQAQVDRADAKEAVAEATAIREKEAATFAAFKAESDANIDAINKAVAALEKGMAGSLLQTDLAQRLKRLATSRADMLEDDRQAILAFLSGGQSGEYAPQSGQITGILKQLSEDMSKSLADATETEEKAIATFEELVKAKTKEINACTESVETKTRRIGELGVAIVEMQNDLALTQESLAEDQQFLAELEKGCSTKTGEWEERSKTRSEELLALAEVIKLLNDDDALDLFKKTLPSSEGASFVQVANGDKLRQGALGAIAKARGDHSRGSHAQLDLLAMALTGKKVDFSKVVSMIDEMVEVLKKEQVDDDSKKEYCEKQFDNTDDKKKELEHTVEDTQTAIEAAETGIATLKEEMASLEASIQSLDKAVAQASETRMLENKEYKELMASDSAAKELLGVAKNRLNKFYNPKLYKPPAKVELSAQDRIATNMGMGAAAALVQVSLSHRDAPAPPPETWGAYSRKGEESTGVIAMVDLLIKDLDKEITEAETDEKNSQKDYEALMSDSAAKRTEDSKGLTEKGALKADLEAALEKHTEAEKMGTRDLMMTEKYISELHAECDWLLKYFEARQEARSEEIDSLGKAKAVLSGADFSLL
mmetsp:Transcript_33665/g.88158  ORF Transcript_33665/g.88158 Transcript_33665/m.88158 type:complete len:700 (-) Transcript_33665:88-2187(-)